MTKKEHNNLVTMIKVLVTIIDLQVLLPIKKMYFMLFELVNKTENNLPVIHCMMSSRDTECIKYELI